MFKYFISYLHVIKYWTSVHFLIKIKKKLQIFSEISICCRILYIPDDNKFNFRMASIWTFSFSLIFPGLFTHDSFEKIYLFFLVYQQNDFQKTKLTHYTIKLKIFLISMKKLLNKSFVYCRKYQNWLQIEQFLIKIFYKFRKLYEMSPFLPRNWAMSDQFQNCTEISRFQLKFYESPKLADHPGLFRANAKQNIWLY